jgi:PBP1b-binding outer membrane lipoprotein LpoB
MMNRPLTIAIALLLSGCAAKSAPEVVPEPMPALAPVVRRPAPLPLPPIPPDVASVATLTPPEIVVAADQARTDATGYVAWTHSKAANIDRLTTLTAALNTAIAQMQAGKVGGKYRPTDVTAARLALRELRSFLATKGD